VIRYFIIDCAPAQHWPRHETRAIKTGGGATTFRVDIDGFVNWKLRQLCRSDDCNCLIKRQR
jgi:hypothetical protein